MCAHLIIIAFFLLIPSFGLAQPATPPRPPILLVVPESDTTTTSSATYRLSASTMPGNAITLNGKPLKVYPSGAFVSLLNLAVGENNFVLTASNDSGVVASRTFLIVRNKPLETTSGDTLALEDVLIEPSTDLWLTSGDILRVQCKGTPNCKATFMNGIPMTEASPSDAGGLGGVYRGMYVVKDGDQWKDSAVVFRLEDAGQSVVTKSTRGRVSVRTSDFPLVATTRGERPYLNFGLGSDRLGGAKLSHINPGIRLAINGKAGDQYRVALADGYEAWIPENMVDLQPQGTPPPFSLTGSWNVYGDQQFDYVSISLSDKLPYASFTETNPTKLCIDVFGAVSNSNWITQHLTTREVTNVRYEQRGKNVFRVIVELKHRQLWGYEIDYRGTNLVIKIRRQPKKLGVGDLVFALDAGHGGQNEGALGSTGAKEKDVNLATVYHLKRLLEKHGARVILTRAGDSYSPNSERLKQVLGSGADILISIHSNSIGNTSDPEVVKGVSTYYRHVCYRPLTQYIYNEVLTTGLVPFGNVGGFNFTLNSPTEVPNVLVELAFMSNPEDEMKLLDDGFRSELAERILDGVEEFLDVCDDDD